MSKKIGLLLRSYAKKPEDVAGVAARAIKSIEHARSLYDDSGDLMIGKIVVLIPADYDCGETAFAIIQALPVSVPEDEVFVIEVLGHHSCGALNHGVEVLSTLGVEYAVIISNKAIEALTTDTMVAMSEALDNGAKVVGVAVDELQEIVLEGRIQNTFAGWDIRALLDVGGFDSENGVEEFSPTVRLILEHGPCIAVLDPTDKPALDIRKSADGKARHEEVMTTKRKRQQEEADRMEVDFIFIKNGIMPGYPRTI